MYFDGVLAEVGVELCAKRRLRLECERDVLLVRLQPLLEQQGEVSGGGGSGGGDGFLRASSSGLWELSLNNCMKVSSFSVQNSESCAAG